MAHKPHVTERPYCHPERSRRIWTGVRQSPRHTPPPPHRHSTPQAGTQGTGAATPSTLHINVHVPSPGEHRRAGIGRYPGDGRGKHHNRYPTPTPPHPIRHSGPRSGTQGGAASPQPSSPRHSPSPPLSRRPYCHPERPYGHPERSRRTPFITNSPAIPVPPTTANARP